MVQRKSIPKKLRFEVFKRDQFKCQYCGASAPDVLLHIDHITSVAEGGGNSILNLITSCESCNQGKGKRGLSDSSVIQKQKNQLNELQERREQLKLMVDWQEGLQNLQEEAVDKYIEYFNRVHLTNMSLTPYGRGQARKFINKYGIEKVFEAVKVCAEKYSNLDEEERLNKISGILYFLSSSESEKQVMYIKGICRNRFYFDPVEGIPLIRSVLEQYQYEFVCDIAKTSDSWTKWKNRMYQLLSYEN